MASRTGKSLGDLPFHGAPLQDLVWVTLGLKTLKKRSIRLFREFRVKAKLEIECRPTANKDSMTGTVRRPQVNKRSDDLFDRTISWLDGVIARFASCI